MSAHGDSNSHGNDDVRFEASDVSTRPVVLSVASLAVFTVIFTFVAHLTFQGLAARQKADSPPASPLADLAPKLPPEPRLQLDPKMDLVTLRAAEEKILGSFAWVDKDKGVVQVPIDRAMQMLLAKGLPARQGPVPFKMEPHDGVAPSQDREGAGAPDWQGENEGEQPAHGSHAAAAPHEAAAEAHGH